jgi:hypothetical protein
MEDFVKTRKVNFGIPLEVPTAKSIKGYDVKYAFEFVKSRRNMVVVGREYYKKCVRLMHMRLLSDMSLDMIWLPQSLLTRDYYRLEVAEVVAMVSLYEETEDKYRGLAGSFMNKALKANSQVLLGALSLKELEGAFPYDLERIENDFVVWKGKD